MSLPKVMIVCPKTGGKVFTGYMMNYSSFQSSSIEDETIINCSECDGSHTWSKPDATLVEQP